MNSPKEKVLEIVTQIPKGKITSYGRIANITGLNARTVGFILSGLTKDECNTYPWHRVVNRFGFISASKLGEKGMLQEMLLKNEGLEVIEFQIQNLEKYWD